MNYIELRKILEECWDETTKYPNSKGNLFGVKSRGQCYPTALLIKRLFKGNIIKGKVGRETHYWNKIDDIEVDLTSDQYGGDGLHPVATRHIICVVHPYDLMDPRDIKLWENYQKVIK